MLSLLHVILKHQLHGSPEKQRALAPKCKWCCSSRCSPCMGISLLSLRVRPWLQGEH